jgi:hypothetical protein
MDVTDMLDEHARQLLQVVCARVLEVGTDELLLPPPRRQRVLGLLELLAIALAGHHPERAAVI